jgi:hypothetical protein
VLRVNRHDLAAAGAGRLGDELTGHYQGFFISERHPLAGPQGRERGFQARCADHRVHHDVCLGVSRRIHQNLRAGGPAAVV